MNFISNLFSPKSVGDEACDIVRRHLTRINAKSNQNFNVYEFTELFAYCSFVLDYLLNYHKSKERNTVFNILGESFKKNVQKNFNSDVSMLLKQVDKRIQEYAIIQSKKVTGFQSPISKAHEYIALAHSNNKFYERSVNEPLMIFDVFDQAEVIADFDKDFAPFVKSVCERYK